MAENATTIQVSERVWERIHHKQRLGDSKSDVIERVLDSNEELRQEIDQLQNELQSLRERNDNGTVNQTA